MDVAVEVEVKVEGGEEKGGKRTDDNPSWGAESAQPRYTATGSCRTSYPAKSLAEGDGAAIERQKTLEMQI